MSNLSLPIRKSGRQSAAAKARYEQELADFCEAVLQIRSNFQVSARGWCYILEEYGLLKGDFDKAQSLIADCRKKGLLPLDIVAEDSARQFGGLEFVDDHDADTEAESIFEGIENAHLAYTPFSFWEDKGVFIQALVEKIDLKGLFGPIFREFPIPFANARGWSDLNSRAALMRRFQEMERAGKDCVLLYCGDHDPGGLAISSFLRSNMAELSEAVNWSPRNLHIDRFGLNYDFIETHSLTWIENLETGSKRRLDDPRHPDHHKAYVQTYLEQFGARKVEANALVVRPEAGRELCRQAVLQYVDAGAPQRYLEALQPHRTEVREAVRMRLEVRP